MPQLIFLPILPHRCIQCVIKFSVDIDRDMVSPYSLIVSPAMVSPCRKRSADCINVSWHMHGHLVHGRLVHGLLYFHAYSKLPCTVQQVAILLGLAWSPVPLPYVHDTWYPNGNNKKPHFGGYSNKFYISCIAT